MNDMPQAVYILNYILLSFLIVLSLPVCILLLQTVLALFANKKKHATFDYANIKRPHVAILIPAHNEGLGVEQAINALMPQMSANDQLLVIADNCTDNTAEVARGAGADVVERFHNTERGKGYALDYGMQHLSSGAPEVLIIVDADCIVASDFIEKASKACLELGRPVQVDYLMQFSVQKTLKQKVIELAWIVKNKVRPTGYKVLGFPCQLMGTGMAFLWRDIKQCNVASGNLVEDMQLGLDFAEMRKPPYYFADTHVLSYFPISNEGMESQRKRWEHGHIDTILTSFPLLLKSIYTGNPRLLMQVLDLMVPPLALLMMLVLGTVALSAALAYFLQAQTFITLYALMLFVMLSLSILFAWAGYGRQVIKLSELMIAPLILMKKLPLYIGFVFNRQIDWVRSKRD